MKKTFIFLAVMSLLCSCKQGENEEEGAAKAPVAAERVTKVSVEPASIQSVPQESVYSSTVQASAVNNIAPQSVGRIQSLKGEVGNFVSRGQVLVTMDETALQQAKIKLSNDQLEYDRLKALLDEGGVSQADFDQISMGLKLDHSNVDNLTQNTYLRSPISGVISARNYDKGDMYSMGQPIFTVQQITPVKLLVGVSESDYTKVKVGQNVDITVDALPDRFFTGKVIRLHPTMDAASHTFNAEVHVTNSNRELRPGMYARVTVNFGANSSIVVPDAAIVKQQGSAVRFVYVLNEDNTVTQKPVQLGRHFGMNQEILSGIQEGEKIVVKGASVLSDGRKVEVI